MNIKTLFCLLMVSSAAQAAEPGLQQAVQHGADLFQHSSFGGSGTCETCHQNGGHTQGKLPNGKAIPSLEGAAARFPRWNAHAQRVVTLGGQIRSCITGALQGKPPAADSAEFADLETYLASLSKGAVMGGQF